MRISTYLAQRAKLIDRHLERYLPASTASPQVIHKALRYSVFGGGKRLRPIIAIEACRACGGEISDVMPAACALELIHTYSLVHDDLPSMDNDDYRRGRPTVHKKFGEAIAVLAGDALLSLAFYLMTKNSNGAGGYRVVRDIAYAIGTHGMIGGQVLDIATKRKGRLALERIHADKTAALFAVSAKTGAIMAGAPQSKIKALDLFGRYVGLSFQITDDILDKEDYFRLCGEHGARRQAQRLIQKAKDALVPLGHRAKKLTAIAEFIAQRDV